MNAAAVGRGKAQLPADEQAQPQQHADLALTALRAALAAGFHDFQQMQTDPDPSILRDRPEFEQLVAPGKPDAKKAEPAPAAK